MERGLINYKQNYPLLRIQLGHRTGYGTASRKDVTFAKRRCLARFILSKIMSVDTDDTSNELLINNDFYCHVLSSCLRSSHVELV